MALNANGYPTGATPTSSVAAAVSTAGATAFATYALYDNSEVDVIDVGRGRNSFFSVMLALSRSNSGGAYDSMGMFETTSENYPEFQWQNRDEEGYSFTLNANATNVATTLVFTSTAGLFAGKVLRNVVTNETVTVVSVTNATDIVVIRGAGALAMVSGEKFINAGTAAAVGQASLTFVAASNSNKSNYFQHFVSTMEFTDLNMFQSKAGGNKKEATDRIVADKLLSHSNDIEYAMLFGKKATVTDPTFGVRYMMDGIIEFASRGWTADISGGLTVSTLETALGYPLRYTKGGASTKILVCGSKARSALLGLYAAQVRTENLKEINLSVNKIMTSTGDYVILSHPFLDESTGDWSKCAIVVDPGYTKVAYPTGYSPEKIGYNGKTALKFNTKESTYAKAVLDATTYLTLAVENVNGCGVIKLAP